MLQVEVTWYVRYGASVSMNPLFDLSIENDVGTTIQPGNALNMNVCGAVGPVRTDNQSTENSRTKPTNQPRRNSVRELYTRLLMKHNLLVVYYAKQGSLRAILNMILYMKLKISEKQTLQDIGHRGQ